MDGEEKRRKMLLRELGCVLSNQRREREREREREHLIRNDIKFLLILPLYIGSSLQSRKVGDASSLNQRRDLLASDGNARQNDGQFGIDDPNLFLPQKPTGKSLNLVLTPLLLLGNRRRLHAHCSCCNHAAATTTATIP
jgi:hypothetical protein